jgi:hypothetical protein
VVQWEGHQGYIETAFLMVGAVAFLIRAFF